MKKKIYPVHLFVAFGLIFLLSCQETQEQPTGLLPLSDPNNSQGWILNEELSDEFEGTELNKEKWFVEGQNGDYYIWKGRAPSQFVPHNALQEDGKLIIRTRWEPEYNFANESYADGSNDDAYGIFKGKPLPITTATVIRASSDSSKSSYRGYKE